MEQSLVTSDGRLLSRTGGPVSDPIGALGSTLKLQQGCSLRSFLSLLRRHPDLLRLSAFLAAILEEAGDCPPSGCRHDDVAALVVGRTMELIGFPGEPRVEGYFWLRGLAAEKAAGAEQDGAAGLAARMEADKDTRFIPLRLLLDTPLLLGGMKHVVLGDVSRSLYCETRFTLFDVVDGLAWEFGFRGGSQQCSLGR